MGMCRLGGPCIVVGGRKPTVVPASLPGCLTDPAHSAFGSGKLRSKRVVKKKKEFCHGHSGSQEKIINK